MVQKDYAEGLPCPAREASDASSGWSRTDPLRNLAEQYGVAMDEARRFAQQIAAPETEERLASLAGALERGDLALAPPETLADRMLEGAPLAAPRNGRGGRTSETSVADQLAAGDMDEEEEDALASFAELLRNVLRIASWHVPCSSRR